MKNQLLEIQNYFINKITSCDFDICKIEFQRDKWVRFDVIIDDCNFQFGIEPSLNIACFFRGSVELDIPNDRLNNLLQLITAEKANHEAERIAQLKAELAELESPAEV